MLMLQRDLCFGLGGMGHLSIGAAPPATTLLSLPAAMRRQLQRDLDQALALALDVLGRHRPLLENLARDLETRGFLTEADLALALAPITREAESGQDVFDRSGDAAP